MNHRDDYHLAHLHDGGSCVVLHSVRVAQWFPPNVDYWRAERHPNAIHHWQNADARRHLRDVLATGRDGVSGWKKA